MASIWRRMQFWKEITPDSLMVESADLKKDAEEQWIRWKNRYLKLDADIIILKYKVNKLSGEIESGFEPLKKALNDFFVKTQLENELRGLKNKTRYKQGNPEYAHELGRIEEIESDIMSNYTPPPEVLVEPLKSKLKGQITELCNMIEVIEKSSTFTQFSYISIKNINLFERREYANKFNYDTINNVIGNVKCSVDNFIKIEHHDQLAQINHTLQIAFIFIKNFEPFVRNGQFHCKRSKLESAKKYLEEGIAELEQLHNEYYNKELNNDVNDIKRLNKKVSNLLNDF